jgi:hypothetical protein
MAPYATRRYGWIVSEVIGDLVFKGGSSVKPGVRAPLITVGGSVRLEKVDAGDIDFAGAEITRDLQLMSLFGLRWTESASMVLRNAEVGALADWSFSGDDPAADPWPRKLDLRGFSFRKLVSFDNGPDRASFSPEMLQNWLERDISRSVQPYVQLASVLQKAGEIGRANRVLYAGRELARRRAGETRQRARWLGLSLLKWTIGYGIGARYFTALIWVAVFTAIGVATLQLDQMWSHHQIAAGSTGVAWMTFASLDALLPVVTLDKAFSDNVPTNTHFLAAKIVFWTLSIAGWMLGSFLVAGLAGLTQKSS